MSIEKIIQESIDKNPLELKETFAEVLKERMAIAIQEKMDEMAKALYGEEVGLEEAGLAIKHTSNFSPSSSSTTKKSTSASNNLKQKAPPKSTMSHSSTPLKTEEVEQIEERSSENKLKKDVYTAKLGNAADITRSNYSAKELKPITSRSRDEEGSVENARASLKNAVAKMKRAGRAELKYGKDAGFVKTLNDFGKNVRKEEVELEEAKEESPIAGTRKISSHQGKDGHHAEVRYNKDWEEYSVHHYNDGKHMGEGPVSYHGSGKEGKSDATDTAEHTAKHYHVVNGKLKINKEV